MRGGKIESDFLDKRAKGSTSQYVTTNLLEFFDVDIQLTSKLRLGLGEGRDLRAKCS